MDYEKYITESSEYSYSSLSSSKDIDDFNKNMKIVFKSDNDMSKEKTHKSMKAIKYNGQTIGYIGFSRYNIDGKKYLGIGNFMVLPKYQSSGHGTKIISDIIDRYKDTYDEIYCYVEKENTKAISFYKRIADVNTKNLTKYGYYVTLYRKGSSKNESYIEEGYLKDDKDIYYNKDKFDSGEINICFITGLSGSGKSTMGRSMQGSKVEHYELDDVICNDNFSDDNLQEYGGLISSFFKGKGKSFRLIRDDEEHNNSVFNSHKNYEKEITQAFVKHAISYAKSRKNTKFVLDGIWIFMFINPSGLKDCAVYIKGTSSIKSGYRALKRDIDEDKKNNMTTLQIFKHEFKRLKEDVLYAKENQKKLKSFRSYFDNQIQEESYIEESKKYDRPYSADEIKDAYGDDIYNKLVQDPVHKYRMDSGIELIHKEPSKKELERIWNNWNKMSYLQKRESDKKSIELFGKTNKDHYYELLKSYDEESSLSSIKEDSGDGRLSTVLFTKDISPESLIKIYQALTDGEHIIASKPLHGNIGIKISTGEYGGHNFLQPDLIKDLVQYLHGVIIECNTAYVGKRNTTEDHWKTIKAHGFLDIANCDIMDEDGDFTIPVSDPYHIKKNYVGNHLKRYDSILMLSHFKGHAMAGYGGALKNMSIGMASSRGKLNIHTAGEGGDMMKADRDKFLESMVDADMSVMDYMGKENILYINVANNLSIDCDCDAHPKDPDISDIGIFASTDPVALDQACIDAVYNHPEKKKHNLINRITSRNGTHTIDCAYEKGLGNKHYVILDIDQVVEEASTEEDIENESSPASFVKRSSLPAKNQKSHTQYLKRKAHSNKTNDATAQHELPKYNQIGELYVEEVAKSVKVKPIFIVTSYTNTPFGKAIKTFTHSEYTHAAISFDTSLEELYSFNADPKYSSNGYKGGISRESLSSYIESYDRTIIQVNCIFLKPSDFDIVKNTLNDLLENAEKTKYDYGNIINILIGRVKDTGMAMVCSQFVAYILHTADIRLLDKSDNIVTPKDLSTIMNTKVYKIFEGYAKDYEKKRIDRIFRKLKTKALLIKESLLKLCV